MKFYTFSRNILNYKFYFCNKSTSLSSLNKNKIMKKIFSLFLLLISTLNFAQIKGTITDNKGTIIQSVNVFLEGTYNNTSTNNQGKYELNVKNLGKYTIIFKSLGYKNQKTTINIDQFPFILDVVLNEEQIALNEIVIDRKVNPAIAIIQNAIENRKQNSDKTARFKADFYSKGIFKIKDMPKKILGQKIDMGEDFGSNLDSTGSGIIYLSETISKVIFEKPNNIKEKIIASKISGNDKGYSYNTAKNTNYDFYNNTISLGINLISPIANNAFNYYKYKLEGSFFDENNQQIYKIKVLPKRDKEPVFEGFIYIVDDSYAIYAVDFTTKGYRMQDEFTEFINLKQNYSYNSKSKIWSKNAQQLDFKVGAFGIKFSGGFNYVFSNYEFIDSFDKKTFNNEILSFEDNANKKDNQFWENVRPMPLTIEEKTDYTKKDSLLLIRKSERYLDSIDKKHNKFSVLDFIFGYDYKNSFKKHSFKYKGLIDISSFSFNTVQGYSLSSGFEYYKWSDKDGKFSKINSTINYGFSDKRARISGEYSHRLNNQNYAEIAISGGTKVSQFNDNPAISPFINDISTLFFMDNYMKLYNLEFAKINYKQDIANGINLNSKIEYQNRKPLFNTTDYTVISKDKLYTSNNPIDQNDYVNAGFDQHDLMKIGLDFRINFANKYLSRPDGKFNLRNKKYPTLFLGYEKTFAANDTKYEFDHLNVKIYYDFDLSNKGEISINAKAGKFFNATDIAFIDFKHFNGNQAHIGQSDKYLNVFNLLPYYSNSTNDAYFEFHSEYNDQGFLMNKIPLLNLLKTNLVLGLHSLAVPKLKTYTEISIGLDNLGFGKFKMFRIDYVKSYQNDIQTDGVIFGIKIINILE